MLICKIYIFLNSYVYKIVTHNSWGILEKYIVMHLTTVSIYIVLYCSALIPNRMFFYRAFTLG